MQVVFHQFPGLPSGPLLAARWVGLLQHGVLDALVYPDRATAIIDLLWEAAEHPWPQVGGLFWGLGWGGWWGTFRNLEWKSGCWWGLQMMEKSGY